MKSVFQLLGCDDESIFLVIDLVESHWSQSVDCFSVVRGQQQDLILRWGQRSEGCRFSLGVPEALYFVPEYTYSVGSYIVPERTYTKLW